MSALALSFVPMLLPAEWLEKYLPERGRDIAMAVVIFSIVIVAGVWFYIAFPERLSGPERHIHYTSDETVVIIGGGYGVGTVIAARFKKFLFNVAIVDLRDTDGKELMAESRKMKKIRDREMIKEKKARQRALARAKAMGDRFNEEEEHVLLEPENHRVYKCDPTSAEDLEAVKTKIERELGHPTILIWAYTPSLKDASKVFPSFSASLSVFLPALRTADNGGMFITLISSLAHIQPGPKHLKRLAQAYHDIWALHRTTAKALKREKRYDIKQVLVELGHFDERAIDVGLYFDDKLRLLEKRAMKQQEENQLREEEEVLPLQAKTKAESEALAALRRRKTAGFLVRSTPDDEIAKTLFEVVRSGQSEEIYMPPSCGVWGYIGKLPRCINKWVFRGLGVNKTVRGLEPDGLMDEEEVEVPNMVDKAEPKPETKSQETEEKDSIAMKDAN
ncbi:hypothetical protein KEM54_003317 [Ascosphaera aggregata]|nr:hypothetical protein KEM54_003317 [Ascosphaera aggregata]